jgi:DNA polymerase III subunit delta'
MVTRAASASDEKGGTAQPSWLREPLVKLLQSRQGHALLLHGATGVGQFDLAMATAQAWLCEQNDEAVSDATQPACGVCPSCHLFHAHTHPDFLLLVPEAMREQLGWDLEEGATGSEKTSAAKPSKDIKVEAVRKAVAFAQTTSARGRAKVLVVHPAERMNTVAANALLKTLEEPPGQARFVLSSAQADALLPTIRSRCQSLSMPLPDAEMACAWLSMQGVIDPQVFLAAAGGQPQEVLVWFGEGVTAAQLHSLPKQLMQGQVGALAEWPLARVVETLQKVCHDAMRLCNEASPRYFARECWPTDVVFDLAALSAWSRQLQLAARHAEHPWSAPLALQALVLAAAQALNCGTASTNDARTGRPTRASRTDGAGGQPGRPGIR